MEPIAILIDVSWLDTHNTFKNNQLLNNKLPLKKLVEAIASQTSYYHDSDSMIWAEIENSCDTEELDSLDADSLAVLIEVLKEEFYGKVDNAYPSMTNVYVFKEWTDDTTMCLIKEDLIV